MDKRERLGFRVRVRFPHILSGETLGNLLLMTAINLDYLFITLFTIAIKLTKDVYFLRNLGKCQTPRL